MQLASDPRVLVVIAADSNFFPLMQGLIGSMPAFLSRSNVRLACLDLGFQRDERAWLSRHADAVRPPEIHFGLDFGKYSAALRSFMARPFLPEYFPGHDVYLWIDSDIWLQDESILDAYVEGALSHGMAIAHQCERGYRIYPWLFGWTLKHFVLGFGLVNGPYLKTKPHLNAGFFAIERHSPYWVDWQDRYAAAIRRAKAVVPHDQLALNHAVYGSFLAAPNQPEPCLLSASHNWICDLGPPMWNDDTGMFCRPYPPFQTIGALHLAGFSKRKPFVVRRTGGGDFRTYLLPGSSPDTPSRFGPLDGMPARREASAPADAEPGKW